MQKILALLIIFLGLLLSSHYFIFVNHTTRDTITGEISMKKFILIALLAISSLTTLPAKAESDALMATAVVAGAASWAVFTVYSPVAALGLAGALTVSQITLITLEQRKQVKDAVNSDVQNFIQTGIPTIALKQVMEQFRKEDRGLSDEEVVDMILNAVNG